jgi:hypothetical protein
LGTAAYLALGVMAAVFYLERMAFLDMAFQTFHILRTGELQIQSGRFGAAGTQVFAWLAQAAGLPLKGVLLSYSLGHVLYYLLLFLIITFGFRQWKWCLVLLLLSVLMTTHTFYWLSEMPQGLAFLVFIMAWLHRRESIYPVALVGISLAGRRFGDGFLFSPDGVVRHGVLQYFFFCCAKIHRQAGPRCTCWPLAIFLLTVFVKYKVLKLDWYDAMSMERAKAFGELWPNWFDIKSNRDFLRWCLQDYYLIPAGILLNTGFYIWKKQGLKAFLSALFPVGIVPDGQCPVPQRR